MKRSLTRGWAATCLCVAALSACAHAPAPPPEPSVRVVETKVAVPVPCPQLAALGPEPTYPDTDEAIAAEGTIGGLAALYATGRLKRIQRLSEYAIAKATCAF